MTRFEILKMFLILILSLCIAIIIFFCLYDPDKGYGCADYYQKESSLICYFNPRTGMITYMTADLNINSNLIMLGN